MISSPSVVHWKGITDRSDLPSHVVVPMRKNICEAATGPDEGVKRILLETADSCEQIWELNTSKERQRAFGEGKSLYHHDSVSGGLLGDPVADVYAVIARENSCILALADGVSWGEKSRLAARCAVAGCLQYLKTHLCTANTTLDIMEILYNSFKSAHEFILKRDGLLTTLCAAVVCQLKDSDKWGLCVLNVGDSLAFTFSFTTLDTGDIVFLTSDGVSDNFDPVISQCETPSFAHTNSLDSTLDEPRVSERTTNASPDESGSDHDLPRAQLYDLAMVKNMTEVIQKESPIDISAVAVCTNLLLHVLGCTQRKRQHREQIQARANHNPHGGEDRIHQGSERETSRLECEPPGKLDHAAVVAFEVGLYRGNRRGSVFDFFVGIKDGTRRASS